MDFTTAHPTPIPIRINGVSYSVPRFLLPQIRLWAAAREQKTVDAALALCKDDDSRARFRYYYQPPPIDVFTVADYARTAEGIEDILTMQLKSAGVSESDTSALLAAADPLLLRRLCELVTSAATAQADAQGMTEAKDVGTPVDPLPAAGGAPAVNSSTGTPPPLSTDAPVTSPVAPSTGQTSEQTSTAPITA